MSDALVAESTIGITVPGNLFGLNYSSFKLERKLVFNDPTDAAGAALAETQAVEDMTVEVTENFQQLVRQINAAGSQLPTQAAPSYTEQAHVAQAPYQQPAMPQANAGSPQGVAALLNGQAAAAPSASGVLVAHGAYGEVVFPSLQALSKDQLRDGVLRLVSASDGMSVDPSHVMIFDEREQLTQASLTGQTARAGHIGAVKVKNGTPLAGIIGTRALAWIDFDVVAGKLKVSQTKDFKALDFGSRQALAQPAGAGAAPQAGNPF